EGLEQLWFSGEASPWLESPIVSESNNKPLDVLDERGEQLELVSLAIHDVNKTSLVVEPFCRQQSSIHPALRLTIWVAQNRNSLLPRANLRPPPNPSLQTDCAEWATVSRRNDRKMRQEALQIVAV